jgi:hypothetical protein
VLSGAVPFEEVVEQTKLFDGMFVGHRILPNRGGAVVAGPRWLVILVWNPDVRNGADADQFEAADRLRRAACTHLRQLLGRHPEFAPLADTVPDIFDEDTDQFEFPLTDRLPYGEANRVGKRLAHLLLGGEDPLRGETVVPPFGGLLRVVRG